MQARRRSALRTPYATVGARRQPSHRDVSAVVRTRVARLGIERGFGGFAPVRASGGKAG